MDALKTWIIEVAVKKMGPSLLKGAIAALAALLAAHANLLDAMGVFYDPLKHVISINLDTLSNWTIVAGSGVLMAALTGLQHHTTAAVTGAPQTGQPVSLEGPKS